MTISEILCRQAIAAYEACERRGAATSQREWMRTAELITQYIESAGLHSNQREMQLYRANCWMRSLNYPKARDDFLALDNKRSYSAFLFNKGQMHLNLGEIDDAITDFIRILNVKQRDILTLLNLAKCYERKGLVDMANNCYLRVFYHDPTNREALNSCYELNTALGKDEAAFRYADRLVLLERGNPEALYRRGSKYLLRGDIARSEADINAARELFTLASDKALCNLVLEEANLMKIAFSREADQSSQNVSAPLQTYVEAGNLFRQKQMGAAIRKCFELSMESTTRQGRVRKALALIRVAYCQFEADLPSALNNLKTSVALLEGEQLRSAAAHSVYAKLFMCTKEFKEAIPMFNQSLEIVPDQVNVIYLLGYCYETLGERKKAIECYSKAISLAKADALVKALSRRACLLSREGEFALSIEDYTRLVEYQPGDWNHHFQLARCYRKVGQFANALAEQETVKTLATRVDLAVDCEHECQELRFLSKIFGEQGETNSSKQAALKMYLEIEDLKSRNMFRESAQLLETFFSTYPNMWLYNPVAILFYATSLLNDTSDPNNREARFKRGFEYLMRAVEIAEGLTASETAPYSAIYFSIARFWHYREQHHEAIRFYQKALKTIPNNRCIIQELCACYMSTQQAALAMPLYNQLKEIDEDLPKVYALRDEAYCALGKDQEAFDEYSSIIRLGLEEHLEAHFIYFLRGRCGMRLKKPPQSILADYRRALELASSKEFKEKYESELKRTQSILSAQSANSAPATTSSMELLGSQTQMVTVSATTTPSTESSHTVTASFSALSSALSLAQQVTNKTIPKGSVNGLGSMSVVVSQSASGNYSVISNASTSVEPMSVVPSSATASSPNTLTLSSSAGGGFKIPGPPTHRKNAARPQSRNPSPMSISISKTGQPSQSST